MNKKKIHHTQKYMLGYDNFNNYKYVVGKNTVINHKIYHRPFFLRFGYKKVS